MIARRSRRVDGLLGDHKVVHFIVLDNVSDPKGMLGSRQDDPERPPLRSCLQRRRPSRMREYLESQHWEGSRQLKGWDESVPGHSANCPEHEPFFTSRS